MYYKHRQYMGMTQNELLTHLTRQKKPPLVIETIMKTVAEQQRKLRTERITRIQHDLLWAPIIDPAKHELRIVERMRCTNTEDIPRQEALDRYAEVLRELLGGADSCAAQARHCAFQATRKAGAQGNSYSQQRPPLGRLGIRERQGRGACVV